MYKDHVYLLCVSVLRKYLKKWGGGRLFESNTYKNKGHSYDKISCVYCNIQL